MSMDNRCFRITTDDVDELRDRTRDKRLIEACMRWVELVPQLDALIAQITDAFSGVRLGDGTGLWEAEGLDNYATEDECIALRSSDEKDDWRRIDVVTLNRCYAAPTFMNARGFVFHLAAFLIAELNDQHSNGFIDRLIDLNGLPNDWQDLLTNKQRLAIVSTLQLVSQHPDYLEQQSEIDVAIDRLLRGSRLV